MPSSLVVEPDGANSLGKKKLELYVDNILAINLVNHPVLLGRSKHIETKYHFLQEQVALKKLEALYCRIKDQTTNVMTNL